MKPSPSTDQGSAPQRRTAVGLAVTALLLTLSACAGADSGADGEGPGAGGGGRPSGPDGASATAPGVAGAAAGTDGSLRRADALEGGWLATTGGKAVALVVTGREAGLFASGGTVCGGSTGERDGDRTITLTCTSGASDRVDGTVTSVADDSLTVDWKGRPDPETYRRTENGQLPGGLPTGGPSGGAR
ncbi:hypothetical protein OG711_22145 [Streptomyces uncialis]|uniref:hypothetical protein n=1 Tax=Streptomyces uncialis TaxID=1048205 RepID=UPI002E343D4A|nr:hypothetical protein [Streptomyces uncialis]